MRSFFRVKSHTMRIRCHIHAIMLIYKHFAVFLKTMHTDEVHRRNHKQKMATSDEDAAHRSAIQFRFPSVLAPIITFCQFKSTEHYKGVWRALVYTWHGRFSDVSTGNTYRGRSKYKNWRIVKSAPDAIDCDSRGSVRDLSMSHVNARSIRLYVWSFY